MLASEASTIVEMSSTSWRWRVLLASSAAESAWLKDCRGKTLTARAGFLMLHGINLIRVFGRVGYQYQDRSYSFGLAMPPQGSLVKELNEEYAYDKSYAHHCC